MPERLEIGYIIIDPDPDPEEYADEITIRRSHAETSQQTAREREEHIDSSSSGT